MTAASNMLARQFIGSLLLKPKVIPKYVDQRHLVEDDQPSLYAFDALQKLQTGNPVAIAQAMRADGFVQADEKYIQDTFIKFATTFGEPDPEELIGMLARLAEESLTAAALASLSMELRLKKITPAQAVARAGNIPLSTLAPDAVLASDDMGAWAAAQAALRREMVASKKFVTMPNEFPTIQKKIDIVELGTITSVVGKSGIGKSLLAMTMADHLARVCGRRVLYGSSELTKLQLVHRQINKLTGIPLEALRMGYWDEMCDAASGKYKSGGQIFFMECAGMSPSAVLRQASSLDADVVIDYFDMLDLGDSKYKGGFSVNETNIIGFGLTEVKSYVQPNGKIGIILWQVGKNAEDKDTITLIDAMGSAKPRHRSNYGLVLNFGVAEEDTIFQIPPLPGQKATDRGEVSVSRGSYLPYGTLTVGKDSFSGQEGLQIPAFRDGRRSLIYESPKLKWE